MLLSGGLDDVDVADINPIGSISKTDLKRFIAYARDAFDIPILSRFEHPCMSSVCKYVLADKIKLFGSCANRRTGTHHGNLRASRRGADCVL
jgi:hypothetical protein